MLQSVDVDVTSSCYFGDDALGCAIQQWTAAFGGQQLFGVFIGAIVFISFFIMSDGDVAPPAVAILLIGAALVPTLPAQFSGIATTLVVLGLVASIFAVLQRYVLSPATNPL